MPDVGVVERRQPPCVAARRWPEDSPLMGPVMASSGNELPDGLGRQRLGAVGGDDEAALARPAAGHRHPERLEEGDVVLRRAAQRRQVVADDQGVGAGVEAHALQLAEDLLPAAGQADPRPGQDQPEQGDGLQRFPGRQDRRVGQRRAGPGVEQVDRHLAGVELRQFEGEVDPLLQRLAEAHDPAAAQLHAGVHGQPGGGDPVVVGVGGADRREHRPGRLEVVVVAAHPGGGQLRPGPRRGARGSRPPRGPSRSGTASTALMTLSRSRSLGPRTATTMQNWVAPASLVARAAASTSSRSRKG